MRRWTSVEIMNVLLQVATTAGPTGAAPAADVNATTARPEPEVFWPEGELPSQNFDRTTLMPAVRVFTLPANIAQLWASIEAVDRRPYLPNGQVNPTKDQKVKRMMLKMSKGAPLVVVGGPDDGQPLTWNPSSAPRPRGGKADDPKTAWVSELSFLLDIGLQGHLTPAQRVRPKTIEDLMAEINKYAGKTVRLKTGLSAHCRPDAVRYIAQQVAGDNGEPKIITLQDPSGQKGCGKRYYTREFKNPDAGQVDPSNGQVIPPYETTISCDGVIKTEAGEIPCNAALKGFEAVDEILAPLGA